MKNFKNLCKNRYGYQMIDPDNTSMVLYTFMFVGEILFKVFGALILLGALMFGLMVAGIIVIF